MTAARTGAGGGPVRAVLFDYGMTLVTYTRPGDALTRAYQEIASVLAQRFGAGRVPPAAVLLRTVHDAVEASVARHEAGGGLEEIRLGPVYASAYGSLGLRLDRRLLTAVQVLEQRAWFAGMRVPAVTPVALGALRRRGVRLGLCSNAPYLPAALKEQLEHLGLAPLLDSATFSGAVGWRKPSPRIFRRALAAVGSPASAAVMVGDRLREDVDGAHGVGMRAVRLRAHLDDVPVDGERADAVIDSLDELVPLVEAWGG